MTSWGTKNASGHEAFGSMALEMPVVESPAASAADVTSTATGVGTTVAPEANKAGDGGDDLGTSNPWLAPG
jgi:hypothetical protein